MSTNNATMNMDQAQAAIMALLQSSGLMQAPGGEALPKSGSVVVGGNVGANGGGNGGGRAEEVAGRDGSAANGRTVVGGGNSRTVTDKEQWLRLLAVADDIREFIADNDRLLKAKGE